MQLKQNGYTKQMLSLFLLVYFLGPKWHNEHRVEVKKKTQHTNIRESGEMSSIRSGVRMQTANSDTTVACLQVHFRVSQAVSI